MKYTWIFISIIKATLAGIRAFEKEISNDIWHQRWKHEKNRRKAFTVIQ